MPRTTTKKLQIVPNFTSRKSEMLEWLQNINVQCSEIMYKPEPVSYTHLDVYKRQILSGVNFPVEVPEVVSS